MIFEVLNDKNFKIGWTLEVVNKPRNIKSHVAKQILVNCKQNKHILRGK